MRVTISLIIVILCLLFFSSGCEDFCKCEQPYLVLYAFPTEGKLLSEEMTINKTDTILGRVVYSGELSGKDIVLAESGVGMTNAAMTTQKMIDNYNPEKVIFSGIAGGIDTSVHIGDIVVCEKWATHDYGYIGADDLEPGGIGVYLPDEDTLMRVRFFNVDKNMLNTARGINSSMPVLDSIGNRIPQLIVGGNGVSGNQFIDQVEKRLWLSENFEALVTDMETASVAQVCAVNGLPFIAFRSASDLAGGSGSSTADKEIEQFFEVAAENSAKIVLKFLEEI